MAWNKYFNFATEIACKICINLESCAYEKLGFMYNSYYVIGRKYKSDEKSWTFGSPVHECLQCRAF